MRRRNQLRRHADLLDRMAEAVGLDLQEESIRGCLPFGELADAVIKCADCTRVSECEAWLGKEHEPGSLAPGYCLNRAIFDKLSSGHSHAQHTEQKGFSACKR